MLDNFKAGGSVPAQNKDREAHLYWVLGVAPPVISPFACFIPTPSAYSISCSCGVAVHAAIPRASSSVNRASFSLRFLTLPCAC